MIVLQMLNAKSSGHSEKGEWSKNLNEGFKRDFVKVSVIYASLVLKIRNLAVSFLAKGKLGINLRLGLILNCDVIFGITYYFFLDPNLALLPTDQTTNLTKYPLLILHKRKLNFGGNGFLLFYILFLAHVFQIRPF